MKKIKVKTEPKDQPLSYKKPTPGSVKSSSNVQILKSSYTGKLVSASSLPPTFYNSTSVPLGPSQASGTQPRQEFDFYDFVLSEYVTPRTVADAAFDAEVLRSHTYNSTETSPFTFTAPHAVARTETNGPVVRAEEISLELNDLRSTLANVVSAIGGLRSTPPHTHPNTSTASSTSVESSGRPQQSSDSLRKNVFTPSASMSQNVPPRGPDPEAKVPPHAGDEKNKTITNATPSAKGNANPATTSTTTSYKAAEVESASGAQPTATSTTTSSLTGTSTSSTAAPATMTATTNVTATQGGVYRFFKGVTSVFSPSTDAEASVAARSKATPATDKSLSSAVPVPVPPVQGNVTPAKTPTVANTTGSVQAHKPRPATTNVTATQGGAPGLANKVVGVLSSSAAVVKSVAAQGVTRGAATFVPIMATTVFRSVMPVWMTPATAKLLTPVVSHFARNVTHSLLPTNATRRNARSGPTPSHSTSAVGVLTADEMRQQLERQKKVAESRTEQALTGVGNCVKTVFAKSIATGMVQTTFALLMGGTVTSDVALGLMKAGAGIATADGSAVLSGAQQILTSTTVQTAVAAFVISSAIKSSTTWGDMKQFIRKGTGKTARKVLSGATLEAHVIPQDAQKVFAAIVGKQGAETTVAELIDIVTLRLLFVMEKSVEHAGAEAVVDLSARLAADPSAVYDTLHELSATAYAQTMDMLAGKSTLDVKGILTKTEVAARPRTPSGGVVPNAEIPVSDKSGPSANAASTEAGVVQSTQVGAPGKVSVTVPVAGDREPVPETNGDPRASGSTVSVTGSVTPETAGPNVIAVVTVTTPVGETATAATTAEETVTAATTAGKTVTVSSVPSETSQDIKPNGHSNVDQAQLPEKTADPTSETSQASALERVAQRRFREDIESERLGENAQRLLDSTLYTLDANGLKQVLSEEDMVKALAGGIDSGGLELLLPLCDGLLVTAGKDIVKAKALKQFLSSMETQNFNDAAKEFVRAWTGLDSAASAYDLARNVAIGYTNVLQVGGVLTDQSMLEGQGKFYGAFLKQLPTSGQLLAQVGRKLGFDLTKGRVTDLRKVALAVLVGKLNPYSGQSNVDIGRGAAQMLYGGTDDV